jgi:predicted acetyltransferase
VTLEIRPLRPDEMQQFDQNVHTGFSVPLPNADPERPREIKPEWTLCALEDGELATTYAAFPFTLYLNGRTAPAAGVTAVTTLPWHRRRGHLRRIMETDFARMHESGGPALAILYASMAAIYQRFGYSVVSTQLRYTVDPRHIEFSESLPETGRFRAVAREDLSTIQPVYEAFAEQRTGYLVRSDHEWQHLVIGYGPNKPLLVAYEDEGATQGYLIYWPEQKPREAMQFGGTVVATAGELVWRTPGAYRALWNYLRRIDLARQIVCFGVPSDDPAKDLFLEPRMLYAQQSDGLLARIVSVERALTERGYEGDGCVTFEVQDEMAPWNAGCWELEAGEGGARVVRTERDPELAMPVGTLASLMFGHFTASQAARMGRLTVNNAGALRRWDSLFRTTYPPGCGNGF